jgi:hypothetical protein
MAVRFMRCTVAGTSSNVPPAVAPPGETRNSGTSHWESVEKTANDFSLPFVAWSAYNIGNVIEIRE